MKQEKQIDNQSIELTEWHRELAPKLWALLSREEQIATLSVQERIAGLKLEEVLSLYKPEEVLCHYWFEELMAHIDKRQLQKAAEGNS